MANPVINTLRWSQVRRLLDYFDNVPVPEGKGWHTVYGVPRGGAIVAGLLEGRSQERQIGHGGGRYRAVDHPDEATLIVDDIIDSGATRDRFKASHPGTPFRALIDKTIEDHDGYGWVQFPWEDTAERDIADSVTRILQFIGEDPRRDGLRDTPARVVKSWGEIFSGYGKSAADVLKRSFEETADQMVMLDNIEFYSTCEHHMQPFFGKAHVAYIPAHGRVVGISKLARTVEIFSRRLQIQERLTKQVADAIHHELAPHGVAVMMEAKHFCMVCRGVNKQNSVMRTCALLGAFKEQAATRAEFFNLIGR